MEPIKVQPKPLPQPTPAAQALKLILAQSKRQGHTASLTAVLGIYPAY